MLSLDFYRLDSKLSIRKFLDFQISGPSSDRRSPLSNPSALFGTRGAWRSSRSPLVKDFLCGQFAVSGWAFHMKIRCMTKPDVWRNSSYNMNSHNWVIQNSFPWMIRNACSHEFPSSRSSGDQKPRQLPAVRWAASSSVTWPLFLYRMCVH